MKTTISQLFLAIGSVAMLALYASPSIAQIRGTHSQPVSKQGALKQLAQSKPELDDSNEGQEAESNSDRDEQIQKEEDTLEEQLNIDKQPGATVDEAPAPPESLNDNVPESPDEEIQIQQTN